MRFSSIHSTRSAIESQPTQSLRRWRAMRKDYSLAPEKARGPHLRPCIRGIGVAIRRRDVPTAREADDENLALHEPIAAARPVRIAEHADVVRQGSLEPPKDLKPRPLFLTVLGRVYCEDADPGHHDLRGPV